MSSEVQSRMRQSKLDEQFRLMADCSPVLLWLAGSDARCTFFNQTWLEFRGRTLEQEAGYGWAEGIHPEDFERCMNTYMTAFNQRQRFEMEYRLQRFDNEFRWLLDRGVPSYDAEGGFAGFVGSCVDITELKQSNELLRESSRSIARANQQIEKFLFATSHDMREPVRMVASYATLLDSEHGQKLDDQGRLFLGFVREGAGRLAQMVEGLNAYLGLRGVAVNLRQTDLAWLVDSARRMLAPLLEESAGSIMLETPSLPMLCDPDLILRVFQNLFSNALKFRSERPPEVRVSGRNCGDYLEIAVSDNGIGFDESHSERIFQMFLRLVPRSYEGNGIGLAICREILELHGGSIRATSKPGAGSTFVLSLRTSKIESSRAGAATLTQA